MLRPTTALAKERRSWLTLYRHRLWKKIYQNFWGLSPEQSVTFDSGRDHYLHRLETNEGEAMAGRLQYSEHDQFDADHMATRMARKQYFTPMTPMEAYESGFKVTPGELPFVLPRTNCFYDADRKMFKTIVAPFWWKNVPGDEGVSANHPNYFAGAGSSSHLEPTIDNLMHGDNKGERFLPATPEEAAEIEAELKYERDMRNSMIKAVADLNIVEPPPYYVTGQRTWNSIMPWYKAKQQKGTLTPQEDAEPSWEMLVAWRDTASPATPPSTSSSSPPPSSSASPSAASA